MLAYERGDYALDAFGGYLIPNAFTRPGTICRRSSGVAVFGAVAFWGGGRSRWRFRLHRFRPHCNGPGPLDDRLYLPWLIRLDPVCFDLLFRGLHSQTFRQDDVDQLTYRLSGNPFSISAVGVTGSPASWKFGSSLMLIQVDPLTSPSAILAAIISLWSGCSAFQFGCQVCAQRDLSGSTGS